MSTIESRTVFSGRVFTVVQERVQLPHGVESTLDVVQHRGSVVLLPMPDDSSVILVRQYRHAIGTEVWELPAGTLEPGEPAEAAALRECHEEVGLVADRAELLASLYPSPGYTTELMHFYRLTGLRTPAEVAHQDEDEYLEPKTFTLEEVRAAIARGEITDMKTVAALALLSR